MKVLRKLVHLPSLHFLFPTFTYYCRVQIRASNYLVLYRLFCYTVFLEMEKQVIFMIITSYVIFMRKKPHTVLLNLCSGRISHCQ